MQAAQALWNVSLDSAIKWTISLSTSSKRPINGFAAAARNFIAPRQSECVNAIRWARVEKNVIETVVASRVPVFFSREKAFTYRKT